MNYFLYLALLCGFFSCQSMQETVTDSSRQLEEAWLDGRRSLSDKLSSFTHRKSAEKSSQDELQQSLKSIKERLDFLERNMASKSDVDSSVELLRRELSEIKKICQRWKKNLFRKKLYWNRQKSILK